MPSTEKDIAAINALPARIPEDFQKFLLSEYPDDSYDDNMFRFYPATAIKSVKDELGDWSGIPDYHNIVSTLPGHGHYFVFADYMIHLFTYAIKLAEHELSENEVIVICGDQWKTVAGSF